MPIPQWPDALLPSRATRRRIRLRQDFESSVLASDLEEEDVSIQPVPSSPPVRRVAAAPLDSDEARIRREQLLRSLPPVPPPSPQPAAGLPVRPELWAQAAAQDDAGTHGNGGARGPVARFVRIASVGAAMVVCALLLTKGLAEVVWELVAR